MSSNGNNDFISLSNMPFTTSDGDIAPNLTEWTVTSNITSDNRLFRKNGVSVIGRAELRVKEILEMFWPDGQVLQQVPIKSMKYRS